MRFYVYIPAFCGILFWASACWGAAPSVIENNRVPVTGRAGAYSPAVVIGEKQGKYTDIYCSGALIAENVVLTAGHCLVDDKARPYPAAVIRVGVLGVEKEVSGKFPGADAAAVIPNPQYLLCRKHPEMKLCEESGQFYDYGVIVLKENLSKKTGGFFRLRMPSEAELRSKKIVYAGLADDLSEMVTTKGRILELERQRADSGTTYPRILIQHTADVIGGSSGGPIFFDGDSSSVIAVATQEVFIREDGELVDTYNLGLVLTPHMHQWLMKEIGHASIGRHLASAR